MVSLDHRAAEELILARLDDALTPDDERRLDEHVRTCTSCRAQNEHQRRLHDRLTGAIADRGELRRAERRVWSRIEAAPRAPASRPRPGLAGFGVALAVLVLAVIGAGWLRSYRLEVAGDRLPVLYREEVVALDFAAPDAKGAAAPVARGSFAVLQKHIEGRNGLAAVVLADVHLAPDALPASIEVRFRDAGDRSYGILVRTEGLTEPRRATGETRMTYEAPLPPTDRGATRTYEIWVHLDLRSGAYDSGAVAVQVTGAPEGERARPVR